MKKLWASASYFTAPMGRVEDDYPGTRIRYGFSGRMLLYGQFAALGGERLEVDSLERDFYDAKPGYTYRIRRYGNPYEKAIWEEMAP